MGGEFIILGIQFSLILGVSIVAVIYIFTAVASVLWALGEIVRKSAMDNRRAFQTASQLRLEQLKAAHYHTRRKSRISTLVQ